MDLSHPARTNVVCLVAAALTATTLAGAPPPASASGPPPEVAESRTELDLGGVVDHHVHLLGEGLVRDWKSLGVTFSRPDEVYHSPATLLGPPGGAAPPDAIGGAVLVPMAHLYGNEEFRAGLGISIEEERARVREENDHVARQAAAYPGRALALCSVSALRPYAREELERCRTHGGFAGVKLHLASAGVDLRSDEDLAVVEELVGWAERADMPLLVHLDPQREDTDAAAIERFATKVLAPHPGVVIVIAHLGGSGGYGEGTRTAFRTLTRWLAERRRAGEPHDGVHFELSAVVLDKESEGVPPTSQEEAAALAADLRAAGLERIVLGSDYPVFDPRRTLSLLSEVVRLADAEMAAIVRNRVPGLDPGAGGADSGRGPAPSASSSVPLAGD